MISKYQKFETREVHRSKILNAPYNPRTIDEAEKRRLKGNLKKVGLLEPLVWNEITGNLVSGHQRIAIMDSLEGSNDYSLTFSVVQLDPKTEKEQNIFLNNTSAQGRFDLERLKNLVTLENLNVDNCGLSSYDLSILDISAKEITQFNGQEQDVEKIEYDGEYDDEGEIGGLSYDDKKELVKNEKQRIKDGYINAVDEGETYMTLSFSDYNTKIAFCRRFGIPDNEVIFKGEIFSKMIERVS